MTVLIDEVLLQWCWMSLRTNGLRGARDELECRTVQLVELFGRSHTVIKIVNIVPMIGN